MNRPRSFAAATLTLFLALLANSALAHPGHSPGDHGPIHIVTSLYHLAALAGAGAGLWLGARFFARKLPRRALQTLGVLSVITAGLLWGLRA